MKRNFRIKLEFTDQNIADIQAAISDSKVKAIKVRIEASHSGFVNANHFFYTPMGMKNGVVTFTEPYGKPICVDHNTSADPIGRITDAKYIDYKQYDKLPFVKAIKTRDASTIIPEIKSFIKSQDYLSPQYKGLGHAEIFADIIDKDAMQKILDKRYLTVSVAGGVDAAYCSICAADKLKDSCDHMRGEVYDGEKAFLVGANMSFKETSYVNVPADPNTDTKIIQDSEYEFMDGTIEVIDYTVQTGEQQNMKKKLSKLISDSKLILTETLEALGLSQFKLQDAEYDALRKTSFLFAAERALPINDKAHILAAFKMLEEVEDCDEKTEAYAVLNRKYEKEFGKDVSVEDALKTLVTTTDSTTAGKTVEGIDVQEQAAALAEAIAPLISDAIMLKLKESVKVSDSYTADRVEALETEVEILIAENAQITDKYKNIVIGQILTSEGKTEDKEYAEKLSKRSLQSLSDKLEDLTAPAVKKEEADTTDTTGIKDANLNSTDAGNISDEEAEAARLAKEEADRLAAEENNKPLTSSEIKDAYTKIFKTEGLAAANRYFKDLKASGKVPTNFVF